MSFDVSTNLSLRPKILKKQNKKVKNIIKKKKRKKLNKKKGKTNHSSNFFLVENERPFSATTTCCYSTETRPSFRGRQAGSSFPTRRLTRHETTASPSPPRVVLSMSTMTMLIHFRLSGLHVRFWYRIWRPLKPP